MKPKLMLSVVCCLLYAVSAAQWLETTIPVGYCPDALCYNSLNNKVYCACNGPSGDIVFVIDGTTNLVVAEIEIGADVWELCYNPAANKVYCSDMYSDAVTVICGAGDTVIRYIPAQVCRGVMCCDSAGNKVYCAGDTGKVAVICGAGDSMLTVIAAEGEARSICLSPDHHKVFCGWAPSFWPDSLSVIDCVTDSVVATLPVGEEPTGVCYNPTNGYAYCAADYDGSVSVIDGVTNQVVVLIPLGSGVSSICCAPPENKVFCTTSSGRVFVIDAGSNTVVDSMEIGFFSELFYNRLNNKVYCAICHGDSTVTVIDAATHGVLCTIGVGGCPTAFCHNPVQNRVYVANNLSASVSVIRDSGGGVLETPNDEVRMTNGPTIVRGVLRLAEGTGASSSPSWLLDATGRKVAELSPGPNDVSGLVPGVYFLRPAGCGARSAGPARKVIIER